MIFLLALMNLAFAGFNGYPFGGVSIIDDGGAKIKNEFCFPVVVWVNGKAIEVAEKTTVPLGADTWSEWKWQAGRMSTVSQKTMKWPLKNKTTIEGGPGVGVHEGVDYYAYDFLVPVGTPVYAMEGGMVIRSISTFANNHRNKFMKDTANGVEILHQDGTVARYFHFAFNGVSVTPCQQVQAGQEIGKSGNTGYSNAPHLHADVYKAVDGGGHKTIPISFSN